MNHSSIVGAPPLGDQVLLTLTSFPVYAMTSTRRTSTVIMTREPIPFGLSVAERSRRPLPSPFFDSAADAATLRTNGYGYMQMKIALGHLQPAVYTGDDTVESKDGDHVVGILKEIAVACLARPECFFCPLACGDL